MQLIINTLFNKRNVVNIPGSDLEEWNIDRIKEAGRILVHTAGGQRYIHRSSILLQLL